MTRYESLESLYRSVNTPIDLDQANHFINETRDFSDEIFDAACRTLSRQSTFFPKLAEFLAACRLEQKHLSESDPRGWRRCKHCEDTGFILERCPGTEPRTCGRTKEVEYHKGIFWGLCRYPHDFVRRCGHVSP